MPGGSADHDADSIEASHKPAVCSYQLDMRYYNDLMDSVPMEAVSVPILLHSMIEQVRTRLACRGDEQLRANVRTKQK